jgi:hypothetical protein
MPENAGPWSQARSPSRGQNFMAWRNVKYLIPGTGRLFRHGRRKKSNSKDIMVQHYALYILHNARTPTTIELTTAETLASVWVHQHGCRQQRKGDLGLHVGNIVFKMDNHKQ